MVLAQCWIEVAAFSSKKEKRHCQTGVQTGQAQSEISETYKKKQPSHAEVGAGKREIASVFCSLTSPGGG
jgi:hypothetical protein